MEIVIIEQHVEPGEKDRRRSWSWGSPHETGEIRGTKQFVIERIVDMHPGVTKIVIHELDEEE